MSSQYRNSELAYEAPGPVYLGETFQRPAQLAYADYQNSAGRDSYSANLPPVEFEDRASHHHFPRHHHQQHHRRHGEVSVSHSHHIHHEIHHETHHAQHRPYHHHNYKHAEHSGVNLSYSQHHRDGRLESNKPRELSVDLNYLLKPEKTSYSDGPITNELAALENKLARTALNVAHRIGTYGNCAYGPRLTFDKFGYHLPPVVATEQGEKIATSKLFTHVRPGDVRPGDYGVRDWSPSVAHHAGINKGDSFIVTSVSGRGQILAANDHTFVVPADGGRYRNLQYYRPNAEFLKLYGTPA